MVSGCPFADCNSVGWRFMCSVCIDVRSLIRHLPRFSGTPSLGSHCETVIYHTLRLRSDISVYSGCSCRNGKHILTMAHDTNSYYHPRRLFVCESCVWLLCGSHFLEVEKQRHRRLHDYISCQQRLYPRCHWSAKMMFTSLSIAKLAADSK